MRDHKQTTQIQPRDRAAAGGSAFPQTLGKVPAGHLQCGRQSEHNPAQDGDDTRETEHPPVGLRIQVNRKRKWRKQRDQDIAKAIGENNATDAANQAEQNAFGEQLSHDTPASRSKRQTNGHLALPGSGSRQQQIGDVGARDQQNAGGRSD